MKIVFVGLLDECMGFRLAGLDTVAVETDREFKEAMEKLLKDSDIAVIVVSEKFADVFDSKLKEKLGKKALPSIVFVPSIDGTKSKQSLKEFLAGVLGVRLQ